jgi:hypothetical protein
MHSMVPYEFAQQISADGRPWGFTYSTPYKFDDQGRVIDRRRKSPCGIWYALVGENNTTRQYVIRRDKLNDVASIEEFRWRVFLRHLKTWERYQEAREAGKACGRIWSAEHRCFHVYDGSGGLSPEREAKHLNVIDKLVRIPTPEEMEAGEVYFAADAALERSFGRRGFADLLLRRAFSVANPEPVSYKQQPQTAARMVRHIVNGREYIHYTPTGWAQKTITLWPEPSDNIEQTVYGPRMFKCQSCGVRFKASGETRCGVCLPLRRGTPAPVRTRDAARR